MSIAIQPRRVPVLDDGPVLQDPRNSKLGPGIYSFSIPAMLTCPGATNTCLSLCYACRGFFVMPSVAASHRRAYNASLRADFSRRMIHDIRERWVQVVRAHPAGDFYDAPYVAKWQAIAAACKSTTFFAYTRSWRIPAILPSLIKLAKQPNVQLWFSEDNETGPSPVVSGVRVAHVVATAEDEATISTRASLVFRERTHLKLQPARVKRINDVLVCPYEQGGGAAKLTCTRCRICFTDYQPRRSQ